jgi:hypothetical protein
MMMERIQIMVRHIMLGAIVMVLAMLSWVVGKTVVGWL